MKLAFICPKRNKDGGMETVECMASSIWCEIHLQKMCFGIEWGVVNTWGVWLLVWQSNIVEKPLRKPQWKDGDIWMYASSTWSCFTYNYVIHYSSACFGEMSRIVDSISRSNINKCLLFWAITTYTFSITHVQFNF